MNHPFRLCRIETASAHAGPGEPSRFFFQGRWWPVEAIEDRWYEGGIQPETQLILYFRVTSGDASFLLRYLPYFQRWQIRRTGEP